MTERAGVASLITRPPPRLYSLPPVLRSGRVETVNEATCDMILHRILDAADSVKAQIDLSNVGARASPRLPLL